MGKSWGTMSDHIRGSGTQLLLPNEKHEPNQPSYKAPGDSKGVAAPKTSRRTRLRPFLDRLAKGVISFGGIAVILSILAIFVFLILEILPLFQKTTATEVARITLPGAPVEHGPALVGLDEHLEVVYALTSSDIQFTELATGRLIAVEQPEVFVGRQITAMAQAGSGSSGHVVGTADGLVIPLKISVRTQFAESGVRTKQPTVAVSQAMKIAEGPITALAYRYGESGAGIVAVVDRHDALFVQPVDEEAARETPLIIPLSLPQGSITTVAVDSPLRNIYAGTSQGQVHHVSIPDRDQALLAGSYQITERSNAITNLGFLIGDRSLVVMTDAGGVSTWGLVRTAPNSDRWQLKQTHLLKSHSAPVISFTASQRDKSFATADANGGIFVQHATSEQTLLALSGHGVTPLSLALSPKADGVLQYDAQRTLTLYKLHNPHPEITLGTLFGKVWYEGYEEPTHVWQSSSGSDDFEPKFGMMPLAFGTLKGTFYALLLAIPVAIFSAIFTSQFMHPNLRAKIKPTIEVMAALPTVVLGFLAGLWLAPLLERLFPAFIGMAITIPLAVVATSFLWRLVPRTIRHQLRVGSEAFILIPVISVCVIVCIWNNLAIEHFLFGGNFELWLSETFNVRYDQRNAVVVGIVMGIAIIPIIYSISEEALSNVPRNLIAGSLALGATRWQTVAHMVLLAASPGIFSAVMIGFGRAIGETMIVLMATGNTPVMNWSMFDGFRTLSANIAVEIPEAPHGGTLYRVLFLAALLLFISTFFINTLAEIVRQRLRKKHSHA